MDKKKSEIAPILNDFYRKIKNMIKIEKIILFGSRANGTSKLDSDVDIIIVSNNFKNEKSFKRSPKLYHEWNYPYDVDIICLTPKELKEKTKQIGIIRQAVKEGIEIV